jgi:general secretion pathway protein D
VLRDVESTDRVSLERYEQIRSFQKEMQPTPNILLPVGGAPVVPSIPRIDRTDTPISAPQTSPGTEPGVLRRPVPAAGDPPAPLPAPIVVPIPSAPASTPR